MNKFYAGELYHFGILGQKWGKKNGPPYPLDYDDHTSEQKKLNKGFHLTDNQKKAIIVGAALAGTALAAYGGYRLYQYNKIMKGEKIDPLTGFKLLSKIESDKEIVNKINPGRISIPTIFTPINAKLGVKKNIEIISGSSNNCMLCTTAYELRKRGYDIKAGLSNSGFTPDDLFPKIYKDYNSTTTIFSRDLFSSNLKGPNTINDKYDKIMKTLSKLPKGSRGNLMLTKYFVGGHSIIFSNDESGLKIMDGQTGNTYTKSQLKTLLKTMSDRVEYLRTDNLQLNIDGIKKYMNTQDTNNLEYYSKKGSEIAFKIATNPEILGTATIASIAYDKYKKKNGGNKNGRSSKSNENVKR